MAGYENIWADDPATVNKQNWDRPLGGPTLPGLLALRASTERRIADTEAGHYDRDHRVYGRAWALDGHRRALAKLNELITTLETIERENDLMDLEA